MPSTKLQSNEELSWFMSPTPKRKSQSLPKYTFTWIDIFIILFSIGTFIADIITDILVVVLYWYNDELAWAVLTLIFFVVPAIIMQIFSARWYIADGRTMTKSLILVHIFMLGPIQRYISVLCHGFKARKTKRIEDYQLMYSELSDVSMLRLFECFLESAPQLVLQLHIVILVEGEDYVLTGISACFSMLSLSWTIVAYTRALRAAANTRARITLIGAILHSIWRGGMVLARLTAILMFATAYREWTLLLLGLHWFIMTVWIVLQDTDFCNSWWEERLFNVIVGNIYIFCFFNMKEGRSRYRAAFYYTVVLIENSIMILLWWFDREEGKWYNVPALCAVWIGFAIGLLCMILYYSYFHPTSKHSCRCSPLACCQMLCIDKVNSTSTSPYKKVNGDIASGRDFASVDSSSEEAFDSRDFSELRCSFDTTLTRNTRADGLRRKCTKRLFDSRHRCPESSMQVSTYDHVGGDVDNPDLSRMRSDVMVIGNARKGFQLKHTVQPDAGTSAPNQFVVMPLPRATSTPGDDLRPSVQATPTKTHRPRSPNTLVKKWVKQTQEMYENDGVFYSPKEGSGKRFATTEDRANHRINVLRMKSFSKSDRLCGKSDVERDRKKVKRTMRDSFRQAFGFRDTRLEDLSEVAESLDRGDAESATAEITAKPAHFIKNRIDRPPSPASLNTGAKIHGSYIKTLPPVNPSENVSHSNNDRTTEVGRIGSSNKDVLSNSTVIRRPCPTESDGARKKLTFVRPMTLDSKVKSDVENQCSSPLKIRSPVSEKRRVLGSIENRC